MKSSFRVSVFLASLAIMGSTSAILARSSAAFIPAATPYPELSEKISDFHLIDGAGVLRGSTPNAEGVKALARAHVVTVIDLQGGDVTGPGIPVLGRVIGLVVPAVEKGESKKDLLLEEKRVTEAGMTFVNEPLNSMRSISIVEEATIAEAIEIMHDSKRQPVYVHCAHGHDRTGLVVALYRVRYNGFSPKEAHDEMVALGHTGFMNHVVTGEMDNFFWKKAPEYQSEYQRRTAR